MRVGAHTIRGARVQQISSSLLSPLPPSPVSLLRLFAILSSLCTFVPRFEPPRASGLLHTHAANYKLPFPSLCNPPPPSSTLDTFPLREEKRGPRHRWRFSEGEGKQPTLSDAAAEVLIHALPLPPPPPFSFAFPGAFPSTFPHSSPSACVYALVSLRSLLHSSSLLSVLLAPLPRSFDSCTPTSLCIAFSLSLSLPPLLTLARTKHPTSWLACTRTRTWAARDGKPRISRACQDARIRARARGKRHLSWAWREVIEFSVSRFGYRAGLRELLVPFFFLSFSFSFRRTTAGRWVGFSSVETLKLRLCWGFWSYFLLILE